MNFLTIATVGDIVQHAGLWFVAPAAALLALYMAFHFSKTVMTRSEGEPAMIEIAQAVREGAMAYLKRQYMVVGIVFVVLIAILLVMALMDIQSYWTVIGVPIAGLFSGLCGWFGMKMATNASARTAYAAKQSLNEGLTVAFRSGAVMGLVVVGFALLDVSAWFFVWNIIMPEGWTLVEVTTIMLSYGMGASTQALFARVGGGIYTKAADVGADLVGKVEAGIPEDDARNPATIADNVGDNVGDVAGMGADLYESYYGSMLATLALGAAAAFTFTHLGMTERGILATKLAAAPMALAGLGILCSLVGIFIVRAREDATFSQLLKSLHSGVWAASGMIAVVSGLLFWFFFADTRGVPEVSAIGIWGAILVGLAAGNVIAFATEYYTSYEHKPTQGISEQAQTGPATVIIGGTAVGMLSTWVPITTIVVSILLAFVFAGGGDTFLLGLYGVGIAAVGMLSTLGITLATDAYGPIADNAGGNAEMSGQPPHVRERTDMLDALGNTTAATGKGFAIGSAALTALALLAAYISVVQTSLNRQLTPDDAAASALVAQVPEGIREAFGHGNGNGDDHAHAPDRRATVLAAEFQGYRQLAVVDLGTNQRFGGMVVMPDELMYRHFKDQHEIGATIVFHDVEWNRRMNQYEVHYEYMHHDHAHHDEFVIIPTDRAGIRQVLGFYDVTLMNPRVLGGIFVGVMLAFVFCAMTMSAVGRAAYRMMGECRRQFGIMKEQFKKDGMSDEDLGNATSWPMKVMVGDKQYPDYASCVAISTAGAQREMIVPSLLAIIVPIVAGLILGVGGVMGVLVGGLTSGFAVAIFMANAGGAWDNAKKYIEKGHFGGKGSEAHKAGVVGDTVGDPFKDTSGPSLNILIKLIAIVSVVFAGLIVAYSPAIGAMIGLG